MSHRLGVAALALLVTAAAPLTGQTAATISEFTAGGVSVILKPITANDVVAVRLYIKGGSAALAPSTVGIERLMGSALTHGTAKYTHDQFASLSTETGTEIASGADFDFTVITLQAVRQHWAQAWDLFTEAALHPTFPADEVEQLKGQIVDALARRTDVPDTHLTMLADSVLYAGHPYALDPQGTVDAVSALTSDDLAAWHRRRLTKANLLVVVVGNATQADIAAKVAAAFGGLPAGGGEAPIAAPLRVASRDVVTVQRDLPTNYIMGLYAAPGVSSPDYAAFRVATRVLSERLFEEVRTKRNLTYAVSAGLATRLANRGVLYVTAVDPDTTLKVMLSEVRRLQQEPVPPARLGQAVNVFVTNYLMGQQTNMGQAAELGLFEISGGGWENAGRYLDRLRAVTPQDVLRAAQTHFRNARFVVIGDPAKIDRALFTSM